MIEDFSDLCLYTYVIVDEILVQLEPLLKRPGPAPDCTDSELIAMILVGEQKGWDMETNLLSNFHEHRDLFPIIPSQSRFNRRRRHLGRIINAIRLKLLSLMDIAQDSQCVIDSLPIPVCGFHLAPAASREWLVNGADFGKVSSKKQTIFGYKLHLLTTLGGLIRDFILAPASATDLVMGQELLFEHNDLVVVGDKGYVKKKAAQELKALRQIDLCVVPRRNQKIQLPQHVKKLFNQVRQIIETVNGQLKTQLNIETNHAHSFEGLVTRLYSKLTAHTLGIYINRLLGKADFLQIKQLAFPL